MDKTALIEALKKVDPARSEKIAVNKGFWFTGKSVIGYNSGFCISVPFKSDWVGGVQDTLLPLIDNHAGTTIEFGEHKDDHSMIVKVGASKFKLATFDISDFDFKFPKMDDDATFHIADVPEFLFALRAVTRSLGNDVSENEFKGVTFVPKGKTLHMFAFERVSMTHAEIPIGGKTAFERVLIPTAVVNQLLRLTDGVTELEMLIDDKQLIMRTNGVRLWGLIEQQERNPRDFLAYSKELRAKINHDMIAISEDNFPKLPGMIDRACIITQAAVEVTKTKVTWLDGKMFFRSESSRGVAEEVAKPKKGKQGDVVLNVDPERLKRGLDLTKVGMTDQCVIFTNDDGTLHFFVSGS